jgi:hypothetical protein
MTPSKFQSMMARVQTNAYANREADKLKSERFCEMLKRMTKATPAIVSLAERLKTNRR